MPATFTVDLFSTLDGYAAPKPGSWGGYWDKDATQLDEHRAAVYAQEQRMVLGANTYRLFTGLRQMLGTSDEADKAADTWAARMLSLPTTVVSSTLTEVAWPNATLDHGDAVDVVRRLKEESDVPLRSHGSVSMNRSLIAAGLVDSLQLTIFPVISGQSGDDPIHAGGGDYDLELLDSHTFSGGIVELTYRPSPHT